MNDTIDSTPVRKRRLGRKAIALGAAGLALLSGGLAYALWQESINTTPTQVQFGAFDLTETGVAFAVNGKVADPNTYKAAPGDVITWTHTYEITSTATSIAKLKADWTFTDDRAAGATREHTITATITGDGVTQLPDGGFEVALTGGKKTINAVSTVTVPREASNNLIGQSLVFTGNMTVTQL